MGVSSLDAVSFGQHRLTPAQREQWSSDGYMIVEDAVPPADLGVLQQLMAEMLETTRVTQRRYPDEDIRQALFSRTHSLQERPEMMRLLTAEKIFPKVVDILGSNVSLFHAFSPCTRPAYVYTQPPSQLKCPCGGGGL